MATLCCCSSCIYNHCDMTHNSLRIWEEQLDWSYSRLLFLVYVVGLNLQCFFFSMRPGSLSFSKGSAELTWARAVTDANSFTSTSPAALQGVCVWTRMCVGLPSVGLQWIILLRRGTSCSPCRHKAWHCHSNNPPAETPCVVAVTAVPYPKREQGTGQQSERGRREDLKWV